MVGLTEMYWISWPHRLWCAHSEVTEPHLANQLMTKISLVGIVIPYLHLFSTRCYWICLGTKRYPGATVFDQDTTVSYPNAIVWLVNSVPSSKTLLAIDKRINFYKNEQAALCIIKDLNLYPCSRDWSVQTHCFIVLTRPEGSPLWTPLWPSSEIHTGLLFPLGGVVGTLIAMFGTELNVPKIKTLFVTVESLCVTIEVFD